MEAATAATFWAAGDMRPSRRRIVSPTRRGSRPSASVACPASMVTRCSSRSPENSSVSQNGLPCTPSARARTAASGAAPSTSAATSATAARSRRSRDVSAAPSRSRSVTVRSKSVPRRRDGRPGPIRPAAAPGWSADSAARPGSRCQPTADHRGRPRRAGGEQPAPATPGCPGAASSAARATRATARGTIAPAEPPAPEKGVHQHCQVQGSVAGFGHAVADGKASRPARGDDLLEHPALAQSRSALDQPGRRQPRPETAEVLTQAGDFLVSAAQRGRQGCSRSCTETVPAQFHYQPSGGRPATRPRPVQPGRTGATGKTATKRIARSRRVGGRPAG